MQFFFKCCPSGVFFFFLCVCVFVCLGMCAAAHLLLLLLLLNGIALLFFSPTQFSGSILPSSSPLFFFSPFSTGVLNLNEADNVCAFTHDNRAADGRVLCLKPTALFPSFFFLLLRDTLISVCRQKLVLSKSRRRRLPCTPCALLVCLPTKWI